MACNTMLLFFTQNTPLHVSAADVFAVCWWFFVVVPNDPTYTSSEETAVTEHVPAEPFPISSQL